VFLLDERIVLLLAGVNLAVSDDLITRVLLLDGLDLALLHVVEDDDLLLLEVNSHLGDLLLGGQQLAALPLLAHLQHAHLVDVVVLVVVDLRSVDALRLVLHECHTPVHDLIVTVLV
jgi:hypothetical protein